MIYSGKEQIIVAVIVLIGAIIVHKYVYFETIDPLINKVKNFLFRPSFYYNSEDSTIKTKK